MQRRAAAVSAAVFVILAAGAYTFVGLAEEPSVEVEATVTAPTGTTFTLGDTEYRVAEVQDSRATVEWTNRSDRFTATVANNSTVPAADVVWDGQQNRHAATLANGSTIPFNGTDYRVVVPAGEEPTAFDLNSTTIDDSQTFESGDTLTYRGNETSVVSITSSGVTVAWGDPYRVLVAAGEDPTEMTFHQDINVSRVLAANPAVENTVLTDDDGTQYVRYRNGTTTTLSRFLPEPETHTVAEGETVGYQGVEATVLSVGTEEVVLEWFGPDTNSRTASEGSNASLGGSTYLAHFPEGGNELVLTQDFQGYEDSQDRIDYYHERISGIWAATIISGLAAVLLIGLSYLPSRY